MSLARHRVAVLASGCGSGGTTLYTRQATAACLTKAALQPKPVTEAVDFPDDRPPPDYASKAEEGFPKF